MTGTADAGRSFILLIEAIYGTDVAPFAGTNEFPVGELDRVERAVDVGLPELDKPKQFGVIGGEVVVLPSVGVQDPLIVGHPVKDVHQHQSVPVEHEFGFGCAFGRNKWRRHRRISFLRMTA